MIVSGLGVTSTFPCVSCEDDIVDLLWGSSDGPALLFVDTSDRSSTTEVVASDPFSISSGMDILFFLRGGSGTSEGSLVLSSWRSACTGLRFRSERRVGRGGWTLVFTFPPCDLKYSFWMPVSCQSISWTPNQVIGAVEMGEGLMA